MPARPTPILRGAALLEGLFPTPLEKLRRDVALHAAASGVDVETASARQLRAARRGPRLVAQG